MSQPEYLTRREIVRVMRTLPRARFVPTEYAHEAGADHPLPIGCEQTISQPSLVAFMTAALHLWPGARVLEIGTGSGFQAALLARLRCDVFTVEIIPELARSAAACLQALGCTQIHLRCGDGYHGWPEHAPYDAIMVTAAVSVIPPPLVAQLAPGGRLIAPVGPAKDVQSLLLLRKTDPVVRVRRLLDVRFVPFTRQE